MVKLVLVCLSALQCDSEGPDQAGERASRGESKQGRCSLCPVAHGCVVSTTLRLLTTTPVLLPRGRLFSSWDTLQRTTSSLHTAAAGGSRFTRRAVRAQGLHGQAADIICASWRGSTQKQHAAYLERWKEFCNRRNINPFRTSVKRALEFPTQVYKEG